MSDNMHVVEVGKWALAYDPGTGNSLVRLEWLDVPPLGLVLTEKDALGLANAILAQYRDRPAKPGA